MGTLVDLGVKAAKEAAITVVKASAATVGKKVGNKFIERLFPDESVGRAARKDGDAKLDLAIMDRPRTTKWRATVREAAGLYIKAAHNLMGVPRCEAWLAAAKCATMLGDAKTAADYRAKARRNLKIDNLAVLRFCAFVRKFSTPVLKVGALNAIFGGFGAVIEIASLVTLAGPVAGAIRAYLWIGGTGAIGVAISEIMTLYELKLNSIARFGRKNFEGRWYSSEFLDPSFSG